MHTVPNYKLSKTKHFKQVYQHGLETTFFGLGLGLTVIGLGLGLGLMR